MQSALNFLDMFSCTKNVVVIHARIVAELPLSGHLCKAVSSTWNGKIL